MPSATAPRVSPTCMTALMKASRLKVSSSPTWLVAAPAWRRGRWLRGYSWLMQVSADDCIAADRAAKSLLPANMSRTPAVIASNTQRISSWTGWATPLAAASADAARSGSLVTTSEPNASALPGSRLSVSTMPAWFSAFVANFMKSAAIVSSSPASGFGTMK